jgi:hypothetical protein
VYFANADGDQAARIVKSFYGGFGGVEAYAEEAGRIVDGGGVPLSCAALQEVMMRNRHDVAAAVMGLKALVEGS